VSSKFNALRIETIQQIRAYEVTADSLEHAQAVVSVGSLREVDNKEQILTRQEETEERSTVLVVPQPEELPAEIALTAHGRGNSMVATLHLHDNGLYQIQVDNELDPEFWCHITIPPEALDQLLISRRRA
jgi:hypothetical protein